MDNFLDQDIGDRFKLLPNLLNSIEKQQKQLERELSGADFGDATTSEWQKVVSDVRGSISQLDTLQTRCQSLLTGVEGDGVSVKARDCVSGVQSMVEEAVQLQHLQSYLTWIQAILDFHKKVKNDVSNNCVLDAVNNYFQLSNLSSSLEQSECSHLKQFALNVKHMWNVTLTECLSREFSCILNKLKWPLTEQSLSLDALNAWEKNQEKFVEVFEALIQIDDGFDSSFRNLNLCDPIILPIQLLLEPLRKRFKYHFSGDKKTNSKEKPEWCFTQVSSWIQNQSHFLDTKIQPLLDKSNCGPLDARNEFIRGLLQELESKLKADLPDVVYHDVLMSHLIDELLLFEKELRTVFQYPPAAPSLLHLLLSEVEFHKWMTLEKEYAVEHFKVIISEEITPTAWQPAYSGMVDADDTKVPECTEKLMAMLKGIEERYKYLPSERHILQFVDLQRDLLLEFHQDIVTSAKSVSPLDPRCAAYLNASSYIAMVLKEWGESPFFLDLHYRTMSGESTNPSDEAIAQLKLLRHQDQEFAVSAGTIFDAVIEAFSSLVNDMEDSIVQCVVESAKNSCHKYKKEKWYSMPTSEERFPILDVTPSAAELLSSLKAQLVNIETNVSSFLTPQLYERIADKTDYLLLSEVILGTRFSEGGAEQMHYDVTKCLVPFLSKGSVSDVQLFERTREACKLLHLPAGSAQLLHEVLQPAVKPQVHDTQFKEAVAALNELKVHTLSPSEAEQILRLRIVPIH